MGHEDTDSVGETTTSGRFGGLFDSVSNPYTVIFFVALAIIPLGLTPSLQFLFAEMLIFGLFALGFDFLYGYGGIVSFGHAAFYGLGAYMVAMANVHLAIANFWLLLFIAILIPAVYALIIGYISIRASGVYFAILTLAFAQITFIVFDNLTNITGGSNGMAFEVPDVVLLPGVLEFSVFDALPFYYLVFSTLVVTFLILRRLTNSPLGAVLKGVRDNRERVQYLGYDERWYRIIAFSISGGVAGISGAMSSFLASFVGPSVMNFILSGEVIVWTIIGGKGTLIGPIIGAGLIHLLEDELSTYITWWFIPIGIFFITVVIFMPNGLVAGMKRIKDRIGS